MSGHRVHWLKFMVFGLSVGISDFLPRAPSVRPTLLPRLSGAGAHAGGGARLRVGPLWWFNIDRELPWGLILGQGWSSVLWK